MKHHYPVAIGTLALCLGAAAVRLADILLYTELSTGFVTAFPAWWRYAAWLLLWVGLYLPARFVSVRAKALLSHCKPLGVAMLATALLFALGAAMQLVQGGSTKILLLNVLLPLLAALWLALFGKKAITGYSAKFTKASSAFSLLLALPLFFSRMYLQFQVDPAAAVRVSCTLIVFVNAAALMFLLVLGKVVLVPGLPCGHTLFAAGMGAFLFCTGFYLPEELLLFANGMSTPRQLLMALGYGAFGLCGLIAAWQTAGEDTVETVTD